MPVTLAALLERLLHANPDEKLNEALQQAALLSPPVYHSKSDVITLHLEIEKPWESEKLDYVLHSLRLMLHCAPDLTIESRECVMNPSLAHGYLKKFCARPECSAFSTLHPCVKEDNILRFTTSIEEKRQSMEEQKEALEKAYAKYGMPVKVEAVIGEPKSMECSVPVSVPASKPAPRTETPKSEFKPKTGFKKNDWSESSIADLKVGMNRMAVTGKVFDIENTETKAGKLMQLVYISDDSDAILAKRFEGRSATREDLLSLRKGDYVKLCGDVIYDNYNRSNVLMVNKVEPQKAPKRKDNAPEKRVEWHMHTNFSEMDGVSSVESIIQQAWDWGMEAVGICDHNVVQAFPFAQHKTAALKKSDPERKFKVLYGCEMTMVSDEYKTVTNPREGLLEKETFVVFDLETTGLSSRLDTIIEFGAVKVEQGQITETKQFFVNPKRALPANISNLTHITQSDVDAARPIEQCMDEIREFFGDAVLVAHNAKFDMGMINAAAISLGQKPFENPVIDTLPAAYSMLDLRAYRLGAVCKHYGVAYDGEGAHRADYDAEVLSEVFLKMLRSWGPQADLYTLQNLDASSALRKNRGRHIGVYAKNKEGLKELFELVTLSHTTYLKYNPKSTSATGTPVIPRSVLQKYHEKGNLLFGSSCQNGEVFETASTRSEEELLEEVDFYDFIELQPLAVYQNLLDAQTIHNKGDLKKILQFIADAAKAKGKPVIATSDGHYIHPAQKRYREIYINAKSGSMRHPLYWRNDQMRLTHPSPDQHFLTTQEMENAFAWMPAEDVQAMVIDNPKKLAEQCEELFPIKDKLYPPDIEGSDQKLRDICYQTAKEKYGDPLPEPVQARLDRELDAIIGAGYYVVYYISHLLVKKSNEDGYLVGSRGSVGSSFVATMSGITEVNPLKPHYLCPKCHHLEWIEDPQIHSGFDLPDKACPVCGENLIGDGQDIPFETFLGFEGDKVPDIDLNFSGEYQANAHAFTKTIFGDDHVFRAGTVGTVQEKTAYGFIKGYEEEMHMEEKPFSEARRKELAKGCEGVKRTTGQHPGGIVVVPLDMDVHDFTPVQYPANNPYAEWKTTHFDFHQIHDNILKFDILGHVDPTAMKMLERITGIDVQTIPMNDPDTMAIFSSCETLGIDTTRYSEKTGAAGIPEFGTPFVRGILELTKPTTFAELVSISGLSHGTDVWLNNAKDLIDAKICTLRQVIGCRDDIMVDLIRYGLPSKASFTIMESVRKGKGLKPEWEELMKENHVPEWYMDSCRKIKYMFPKAHAVAYVMMAVRIAWFKVHHPRAYYCQYFSIRSDAYDLPVMMGGLHAIEERMKKISEARADKTRKVEAKELAIYDTLELAREMHMRGYHFARLSIYRSAANEFTIDPDDDKAIIPPFTAIDSLGENVAKSIVAAREESPFISKEDVANRTLLSKTLMEKLDLLGVFEDLQDSNQGTLF